MREFEILYSPRDGGKLPARPRLEDGSSSKLKASSTLVPEDIIFEGVQETGVNKTAKMQVMESAIGEHIKTYLQRRYGEGASLAVIAQELANRASETITGGTVLKWMRAFDLPTRSAAESVQNRLRNEEELTRLRDHLNRVRQNPEAQAKRIASMRETWQDPEKKKQRLAKVQSPTAKAKRGAATKARFKNHPEQVAIMREASRQALRKKAEAHKRELLGDNPTEALRRLHIEENKSATQIRELLGRRITRHTVSQWLKESGIFVRRGRRGRPALLKDENVFLVEEAYSQGRLEGLPKNQREVLEARYLGQKKSLKEIGREIGCSHETVRLIEKAALKNLRIL